MPNGGAQRVMAFCRDSAIEGKHREINHDWVPNDRPVSVETGHCLLLRKCVASNHRAGVKANLPGYVDYGTPNLHYVETCVALTDKLGAPLPPSLQGYVVRPPAPTDAPLFLDYLQPRIACSDTPGDATTVPAAAGPSFSSEDEGRLVDLLAKEDAAEDSSDEDSDDGDNEDSAPSKPVSAEDALARSEPPACCGQPISVGMDVLLADATSVDAECAAESAAAFADLPLLFFALGSAAFFLKHIVAPLSLPHPPPLLSHSFLDRCYESGQGQNQ